MDMSETTCSTWDVLFSRDGTGDLLVWAGGINPPTLDELRSRYPRTTAERSVVAVGYRPLRTEDGTLLEQDIQAYAADVCRVLDRLDVARSQVVGSGGLGAMVMLQFLIDFPERVGAAVIAQGTLRMNARHRLISETIRTLRTEVGFAAAQRLMLAMCHTPQYLAAHQEQLTSTSWITFADDEAAERQTAYAQACWAFDATDAARTIRVPTLIVSGDDVDPLMGTWDARAMHATIPGSELVVLGGAPHAVWESRETLEAMDGRMNDFLQRHPIRGGAAL